MQNDTTRPAIVSATTTNTTANSLTGMIATAAAALARATTAAEVFDVIQHTTAIYDAAKSTARLEKARDAHAEIIAACHKAQADALEIEAAAQCRLADEYDAAQARGEIATHSFGNPQIVPVRNDLPLTAAEVGLSGKIVHEARRVRDAERENPGVVRKTLDEQLRRGEAPTRADVKRAIRPEPVVVSAPPKPPVAPGAVRPADDDERPHWAIPFERPAWAARWSADHFLPSCRFCGGRHPDVEIMVCATETDPHGPDEWDDLYPEDNAWICDKCVSKCVEIIEWRRASFVKRR
jgi:hypothetical protein